MKRYKISRENINEWLDLNDVLEAVPTNYPILHGHEWLDFAEKATGQQNSLDQKSCNLIRTKESTLLVEGT
jgi:hypothetical protein